MAQCGDQRRSLNDLFRKRTPLFVASFKRQLTTQLRGLYKFLGRQISKGNVYHSFSVLVEFANKDQILFGVEDSSPYVKLRDAEHGMEVCCQELDKAVAVLLQGKRAPVRVRLLESNLLAVFSESQGRPMSVMLADETILPVTNSRQQSVAERQILAFQNSELLHGRNIESVV